MEKQDSEKRDFLTIGIYIVIFLILVVFIGTFWSSGIFDIKRGASDTKVLAAALALVGVLGTAMVTLIGILFKRSYDKHSLRLMEKQEKRLSIESKHNQAIQKDAEKRLRMETSINAVRLMSTKDGKDASESQQAGALFALATLGQLEFALALLENLWPKKCVDSISATWLIDKGLKSNNIILQDQVCNMLENNISRLLIPKGSYEWPNSYKGEWAIDLPTMVRESLLVSTISVIIARPLKEWNQICLYDIFLSLYKAFIKDKEPRIKAGAAEVVKVLMSTFDNIGSFYVEGGTLSLDTLEKKVNNFLKSEITDSDGIVEYISLDVKELIKELQTWASKK